MKLCRYGNKGFEKPALVDAQNQLRDLSGYINDIDGKALGAESLSRLASLNPDELPVVSGDPRIGPCVSGVGKIICVGLNYSDHAAESGMAVPEEPVIFFKSTTSIVGPNDDVVIPPGATKTDWEVELAVVIGERASYVSEQDAMNHIAGFCILNDVSERSYQLERSGQWVKGKSCDTFAPLGPWLVTEDSIQDIDNLHMTLHVNDHQYQNGSTSTMVFKVAFLVSYISQFMTLEPGDIISTGTPPGVGLGQNPPVYLKPGDKVTLSIESLGTQSQNVVESRKYV